MKTKFDRLQVPLMVSVAWVGRRYGSTWCNLCMWSFLCNQGMQYLAYFHDHILDNYGEEGLHTASMG